jgi:DNA-binding CsgD family transcriptional regulator
MPSFVVLFPLGKRSPAPSVATIRRTSYLRFVPDVTRLDSRDLDRVLALVAEAAAGDGPQPFEFPVIERLLDLVPADRAGYFEYDEGARGKPNLFQVEKPTYDFGWLGISDELLSCWPLHDDRRHAAQIAMKFSDFVNPAAQRHHPWYVEVARPRSVEYECKLWLPSPSGVVRGFFLVRDVRDRDFDERDRSVLTVLRPHLAAVRERWERRRRPPGLTERETEVLQLLRQGLTNREIADRLVIATGTVRTHLENIFEKLGVHTRTAALARAFGPEA